MSEDNTKNSLQKPNYTEDELNLLSFIFDAKEGHVFTWELDCWETVDDPPKTVKLLGRSRLYPQNYTVSVEAPEGEPRGCALTREGRIVGYGKDTWIRMKQPTLTSTYITPLTLFRGYISGRNIGMANNLVLSTPSHGKVIEITNEGELVFHLKDPTESAQEFVEISKTLWNKYIFDMGIEIEQLKSENERLKSLVADSSSYLDNLRDNVEWFRNNSAILAETATIIPMQSEDPNKI